ncbi:PREDICTED: histone deacetylase complex subunit SAP30 [Bison bison bison]|uniref:Histone deacetylase complex subunit SAP30 n=1 Tax=Bison bison bison TaxID=43346 RepID=A0A6P3HGY6_BISBB|nr:PREDICTED: histone deacetylase complex subunit SAP30 [Bison bison bison]
MEGAERQGRNALAQIEGRREVEVSRQQQAGAPWSCLEDPGSELIVSAKQVRGTAETPCISREAGGAESKASVSAALREANNKVLQLGPPSAVNSLAPPGPAPAPPPRVEFSQNRTLRATRTLSRVPRVRGGGPPAASRAAVSSSRAAAQDLGSGQPLRKRPFPLFRALGSGNKSQDARHLYICDYHKNLIQSVRNRRKRKGSDDDGGDSPVQDIDTPEVDLYQLQVNTLRRYKRHFKLPTRPGLNKAQLVEIVGCHFRSIPVNEKDTLTYFIYSVKNDKNKSDLKVDSSVH